MAYLYPSFARLDTAEHLSFFYSGADMLKNLKRLLENYKARFYTQVNEEERRFWEALTDVADTAFFVGSNLHDFAMQAYEAERLLTQENQDLQRAPDRAVLVVGLRDCLYTLIPIWQRVEDLFPYALPLLRQRIQFSDDTIFADCHQLNRHLLQDLGQDIERLDTAFRTFCTWRFTDVLI
jgi:hypothetical protein